MTDALPEAAPARSDALLELELPLEGVRGLLRLAHGPRAQPTALVWHDTGGGDLARRGLALCETGGRWRAERLRPAPAGAASARAAAIRTSRMRSICSALRAIASCAP